MAASRLAAMSRGVLRAERVRDAMISVVFVSSSAIASMNRKHLGKRGSTDVIAFALSDRAGGSVVGDIYICPEVARANARSFGVGVREEIARLVVHGTLHVLGYTHPEGNPREGSAMWKRQESLLRKGLPHISKR